MKRRYGWILNLDAELELSRGRPGYAPPLKLLAQLAEHGAGARALLGPDDRELAVGSWQLAAEPREGVVGRAWCPTPMAVASMRGHGVEPEPYPEAAVLRRVNHRLFAHELGGGLPEQAYVRARAELLANIGRYERHWLLKRPLSFAGRGQLRAIGPLTHKQWTWVEASLKRDGLLVEPLVEPSFEVSLHGFVWRDGRFELGRICAQLVSDRGAFRAARLASAEELTGDESAALTERAKAVARALISAGYFGPFGIDGYRYTLDGARGFCPLGEINARYTLGFVTGFPHHPSELLLE
jgi:hypothetical protein